MSRDDLSGGDFERRKQCCGAMPLVIVALAGQGAAIGQLQITLRSLQGLDEGFPAKHCPNGFAGGAEEGATKTAAFAGKVGAVVLAQGFRATEAILLMRQKRP